MPRKVTEISQIKRDVPIEARQLRVAAYCRVSTRHEEQLHGLEAQIAYYTDYIKRNPNWEFVAVYFGYCIRRPYNQPPWLSDSYERLRQRKSRLDFGEVPQPFWPGRIGDNPPSQETRKNEHRHLY